MKFTKTLHKEDVKKEWIVLDASGVIFGRLISQAASILRGKNKPTFTPNVDCGDNVIIINANKAIFSGNKLQDKLYHKHTGYFGSVKSKKLNVMLEEHTEKLYKLATRGMLPKTKLGAQMLKNLKVYNGSSHPHTAQVKG